MVASAGSPSLAPRKFTSLERQALWWGELGAQRQQIREAWKRETEQGTGEVKGAELRHSGVVEPKGQETGSRERSQLSASLPAAFFPLPRWCLSPSSVRPGRSLPPRLFLSLLLSLILSIFLSPSYSSLSLPPLCNSLSVCLDPCPQALCVCVSHACARAHTLSLSCSRCLDKE